MNFLPFLLIMTLINVSFGESFQTFKFQMQKKVKSISTTIQNIYKTKCQNLLIRNCSRGSIDACRGTGKRECIQNLPKSDQCPGIGFYSRNSVIKIPNWITALNMSEQTKQFICSTAQQQLQSVLFNLQNQNHQQYAWAYFGSNDGTFRFTPGFKYPQSSPGICQDYDPRLRPWYAQNAYTRKNVILIAETSSTMFLSGGSRFNAMILSLNALIRTFDSDDFLNIIEFNSNSKSILNVNYMIPVSGNIDERDIFFNAVKNLTQSKASNIDYQSAFRTALNIINESINGNQTRNDCKQYIILMFSDGNPNCGLKDSLSLIEMIDNQTKKIKDNLSLSIFTFNVNKQQRDIKTSVMSELACYYGGMHFDIPSIVYQSQFMTAAKGYFQFLSFGNQMSQKPSWSSFYSDALGLGQMTTVVFPAYLTIGPVKKLLGVAGIDVLVSQFKKYQPNQTQIQKRLSQDGVCFVKKIKNCQIQFLRDIKCNINNCSFQNKNISIMNSSYFCQNKPINSNKIIIAPVDSSEQRCCLIQESSSHTPLIIAVISGFIFLVLLVVVFCYCKYIRQPTPTYDDLKKFKDFDTTRIRTQQQISPIND